MQAQAAADAPRTCEGNNKWFRLQNGNSNKYLLPNTQSPTKSGVGVRQYYDPDFYPSTWSRWCMLDDTRGYVNLVNAATPNWYAMTISTSSDYDGWINKPVIVYPRSTSNVLQSWRILPGKYSNVRMITNPTTKQCLRMFDRQTADNVQLYAYDQSLCDYNDEAQMWIIKYD
ncbi:hypothetical protein Aab01nite_52550 [Paractinoplanes abujensis]|nr:hypothetical protein Aab01nite_52550 [Actinoplanes abujensis]